MIRPTSSLETVSDQISFLKTTSKTNCSDLEWQMSNENIKQQVLLFRVILESPITKGRLKNINTLVTFSAASSVDFACGQAVPGFPATPGSPFCPLKPKRGFVVDVL